jgi:hypothetical protein
VKGRTIFADAPASMEARAKGEATLDNQNERKPGEPIVPYNHVWRAGRMKQPCSRLLTTF